MTTTTTNEQPSPRVYTDEEIRNVVNMNSDDDEADAFAIVLNLLQRMTIALERIATSMEETTVLFEPDPSLSDDLNTHSD